MRSKIKFPFSRDGRLRMPEDNSNAAFLTIENLSKSYLEGEQRRVVFQNVNMSVKRGEIVAILGKSGSGKTTLLKLDQWH